MITDEETFLKNLTLSTEFSRYILEHSEMADRIPENARVVLLPEDDPDLCEINLRLAKEHSKREPGQPIVYVHVEKMAPARSRLVNPKLELVPE